MTMAGGSLSSSSFGSCIEVGTSLLASPSDVLVVPTNHVIDCNCAILKIRFKSAARNIPGSVFGVGGP